MVNWGKQENYLKVALTILASVLFLNTAPAAGAGDAGPDSAGPTPGTVNFDGLIIDSIEIDNRNIYDTDDPGYSRFVFKLANKLHIRTRRYVVARELLLKEGEPYSQELAEETARNLRNNLIVYDAWTEIEKLPNGKLLVRVVTVDQWSFTGGFNYGREGNETRYQIGFDEKNFLGNNQFVSFYFFSQSDDEDFVEAGFFENRLMGKPLRLQLDFSSNPVSETEGIQVKRPFYSLEQKYSFMVDLRNFSGRRDVYVDSLKIAESFFDGDITQSYAAYRFGPSHRKVTLQLGHEYRFERLGEQRIFSTSASDSALALVSFPDDSLHHELEAEVSYATLEFVKLNQIDGFGYTEDFTLGYYAELAVARAFTPSFSDHVFDKLELRLARYVGSSAHLFLADYYHKLWFRSSRNVRRYALAAASYYGRPSRAVTIALRGSYVSEWNDDDRSDILLGGTSGIRGYDKYFRTGNRKALVHLESRFYPDIRFLSAILGGVIFADWGAIWKPSEPIKMKPSYAAIGAGIRIAFEKSTRNVVRVDVSYSEENQWQLSIGTDQYFRAQSGF